MIKVALADREHLLVQALSHLVGAETDMNVTGMYTDGESLINGLDKSKPKSCSWTPSG
jgi:DNA-binding NarL/FixJ family response regulator